MTSLQKQLATIAASSTHQLDLKAQKAAHGRSLLFEPKVAASQSFENIYLICYDGYRDLCALDPRFVQFSRSLFSEQSKVEDRTQMTKKENDKLNTVLEAFLTLVGPRLLLKTAEKALEWLVRRFRIHEYNTEPLVLTYLPYHNTPQFLALLSILPANPPPALRFLSPYIKSPMNPPRQAIIYNAVNTPAFFNALQNYTVRVLQASHQGSSLISFWSSVTTQTIDAILDYSQSGRREIQDQKTEQLLLRILPVLNECLKISHGPETVTATYMIVIVLATKAALEDKVLDSLMEAVILSQQKDTFEACIMCLAIIAEERSSVQIPGPVIKRLLRVPTLPQSLVTLSRNCRVERLTLGCALGALEGIGPAINSNEKSSIFRTTMESGLLNHAQVSLALSALLRRLRSSEPGSSQHGQLLQLVNNLSESNDTSKILQDLMKEHEQDYQLLGISLHQQSKGDSHSITSEDEDMLDVGEDAWLNGDQSLITLPVITETNFLSSISSKTFQELAEVFKSVITSDQPVNKFLGSKPLRRDEAFNSHLFLSFLVRSWCSSMSASARVVAIRATTVLFRKHPSSLDMQVLIPYLLYALADPSPTVRRSAATCVAALSVTSTTLKSESKTEIWGAEIYGKDAPKMVLLERDQTRDLLSLVVAPILEECVLDAKFVMTSLKDVLEGKQQSKNHGKHSLKSSARNSALSFLASHVALTPLLRVRLRLLPLLNFLGKQTTNIRATVLLPVVRNWCALSHAETQSQLELEQLNLADANYVHINSLLAREPGSVQILMDILSGNVTTERTDIMEVAFDHLNTNWPSFKSESRLSLSQCLLDLSLKEAGTDMTELCRARSLETLRSVRLDTAVLQSFLDSVPAAVQMPEGPPTKKRRRTSRTEAARVEHQSPDEVSRLLPRLTLVLELVEGSDTAEHTGLFKNLFAMLGELQALKQQAGSELVYLQSLILGSLTPIVNKLKEGKDSADYETSVRADLLIDCIRHSPSPQVQNAALLLIASLASWVPELILHNLMPIFTFIGSTLLRQKDDYSAHVVDQTISRVVPQLAMSLRRKNKNFLIGVADLLLSFTAAFEHIPQHRRLKLFSELARTLGPEESLPAITALLFDKYPAGPGQKKFATDLLLMFNPIVTLETFKGYLHLVTDAVGPNRKISDTLFSLSAKKPPQVENTINNLLSSLAELAADQELRRHVGKAFHRKTEPARPRAIFANIAEMTVKLSKRVAERNRVYESCRHVLGNCLDLLPTIDLVKSAELLLVSSDAQVQVAAIKSVEVRTETVLQNDQAAVSSLLTFLAKIEDILQQSEEIEVKIVAVSCIDRIVERFGKKDVAAVSAIAQTLSSAHALANNDDRLRVLSLLCFTSMVDVLEDEAIPFLPTILPVAFKYLEAAIEQNRPALHNAVYTLLSDIVARLGFMFSQEYMIPALKLSQRSAAAAFAAVGDVCDESRTQFYESISKHIGARETFAAIKATWADAISQGFEASHEQLQLVLSTIERQSKSNLIKASSSMFSLFLDVFDIRKAVSSRGDSGFEIEEVEKLEDDLNESVLTMTLKLNDATFRPFFVQLADFASSFKSDKSRSVTFFKFLAVFFDRFKSIVTSYSSYIVEQASDLLAYISEVQDEPQLKKAVLNALHKAFEYDQDGFWQAPSHSGPIMKPLLKQLTIGSAEDLTESVIPAITELAAASSSSMDSHREMNAVLLKYMRADEAKTRLATVKCEQGLTKRLGEEWLGLLPEMLPFISELRDDDDEMVERETQRWITMVEEVLGEDLDAMLQ
ncbi:hypothetical protein BDV95DRAFT_626828 [Massariosphaeria phaeospora]|uniref:U3 small nucleolar RNA-associated protein 10 n=1 Tax=Massariosphaeria phaeospora TaxID=100035 RepID=A0A7C8ICS9_9PLEO|nr:hypothetical protein BDV95DRAFT_626828 [Massariosphaeria phaeospora]